MKYFLPFLLGPLFTIGSTWAFVPAKEHRAAFLTSRGNNQINIATPLPRGVEDGERKLSFSALCSEKKKKGGLDESMRNKLVTESIAPWRTLRLFLYGSLGSGAFVGGLINGSGAIAGSASPEFNLQTELLNVGIDFGFVILMGVCAKFDLDKQTELQQKVDEKIARKKEMKKISKEIKSREAILQSLPLEIRIGNDGTTRAANVADLQKGAKQHMIIVAGPRKACKDALIGANLMKMDFAMSNVLVVPYETDSETTEQLSRPSGGFGDRPSYETQPYIARTTGEEWDDFVEQEIEDAVKQNGETVKTDGIAIVVANNGSIIRRGVGTVPWRQMVEQLEETVNPSEGNTGPLSWMN
eukprot:CAMPEP_0197187646 /NCGR_PEP_ID=MMETSP1423-20130617/16267_1 /TAXON_ID=476441 /ORGANISM="Pseudo-nitzschia heimii, Strain UNC1101" /LENGTH=355 /DNA_ID=CAMNT_0042639279 /DNA_START=68 /DNA_END=1135 /DNA_ORIENTATION=-